MKTIRSIYTKGRLKLRPSGTPRKQHPTCTTVATIHLSDVLDFYNKGGGAGIGLSSPEQTLSGKPLHLSKQEINDIIAFLGALTDNLRPAGKS